MKKILITLFLFAALILSANSVNIEQAKQVATNWFIERGDISNYEIFDVQIEKEKSINLYYIFNFEQDAYVMVAADDAIVPILGYCFEQHFTSENHPPQFDAMLNSFKKQIIYAKDGSASAAEWVSDEWKRLSVKSENFEKIRDLRDVSPLISANWNQDYSWNTYCPSDGSGPGGYVYAGCVAVAMAQVMKYWEHPAQGSGSSSYYC
ncbi:MAG: Spi family protease inhibitor [Candidatus Cloacimonetes bacterium]|nr:Spi family protease inhibitor [Candidatus Cloacimonadota bacterium]